MAVEEADGTYRLYGYKWFSSATDADMTFTLARVVDRQGNTVEVTELASSASGYNTCMCWLLPLVQQEYIKMSKTVVLLQHLLQLVHPLYSCGVCVCMCMNVRVCMNVCVCMCERERETWIGLRSLATYPLFFQFLVICPLMMITIIVRL